MMRLLDSLPRQAPGLRPVPLLAAVVVGATCHAMFAQEPEAPSLDSRADAVNTVIERSVPFVLADISPGAPMRRWFCDSRRFSSMAGSTRQRPSILPPSASTRDWGGDLPKKPRSGTLTSPFFTRRTARSKACCLAETLSGGRSCSTSGWTRTMRAETSPLPRASGTWPACEWSRAVPTTA